ncbi:MAG TPA: OmpA family protein [Terriglobales bacterium]|nr:OmpA family protein [Terriglobales bacterium]
MRATIRRIGLVLISVFCLALSSGFCVTTGQTVKLEGYVVSANGDSVTMRTKDSSDVAVAVTEFTKISTPKGLFRNKRMPSGSLVPGLWIKVQGMGSSPGRVIAKSISFSGNDYRTASAIKAGLVPVDMRFADNERQIQANAQGLQSQESAIQTHEQNIQASQQQIQEINQKFSKLADYDVKYSLNVYFPPGSATLSEGAKNDLIQLARSATSLRSYLIEVEGYTDTSGSPEKNQQLSMRRASSVIAFLQQEGNIPVRRVLMPGAMGESHPASSNTSVQGREANRRAEVQVLVNRGLSGE